MSEVGQELGMYGNQVAVAGEKPARSENIESGHPEGHGGVDRSLPWPGLAMSRRLREIGRTVGLSWGPEGSRRAQGEEPWRFFVADLGRLNNRPQAAPGAIGARAATVDTVHHRPHAPAPGKCRTFPGGGWATSTGNDEGACYRPPPSWAARHGGPAESHLWSKRDRWPEGTPFGLRHRLDIGGSVLGALPGGSGTQ